MLKYPKTFHVINLVVWVLWFKVSEPEQKPDHPKLKAEQLIVKAELGLLGGVITLYKFLKMLNRIFRGCFGLY